MGALICLAVWLLAGLALALVLGRVVVFRARR